MVRGTLNRHDDGWRVVVYETEPVHRTIVEIHAVPCWDEAFGTMSSAIRLFG